MHFKKKKGIVACNVYEKGELVAYAGRWPGGPPEGEPKYKLPPKFHKSQELFNLHRAREYKKEKGLVVVEGYFDVMKLWQAGFKNVVALMGCSLSDEQEEFILKETDKIVLLLDNDAAGREATDTLLPHLAKKAFVRTIELPEGVHQPDSLDEKELATLFKKD